MASYSIIFKPSVEKDMRALPPTVIARVMDKVEALTEDPLPRGVTKLSGTERLYRIRIGDYRVVYEIDTSLCLVTVHYVRHRKDVYQRL